MVPLCVRMDEEEKLKDDQIMQPTTAPALDFTDSKVQAFPDIYAWDEDEFDELFDSYTKLGDEVIGRYRGITTTLYTKF